MNAMEQHNHYYLKQNKIDQSGGVRFKKPKNQINLHHSKSKDSNFNLATSVTHSEMDKITESIESLSYFNQESGISLIQPSPS